jgi:hypothetical protein
MTDIRGLVAGSICAALVAVGIGALLADDAIGWILVPVLVGTLLTASLLFVAHARDRRARLVADSFVSRRTPGDLIDVSRIRVAGLGGAGLTLMAVIAALQSPFTTAALVVSLIGGVLGAVIVILHRRHAAR